MDSVHPIKNNQPQGNRRMTMNKNLDFLINTAKDYGLPLWKVKQISKLSDSCTEFYKRLEQAIKENVLWEND